MALIEEEEAQSSDNQNNNGSSGGGESSNSKEKESLNSQYECNICLDTARDAVISMCGHLFCWPCLHKWLETRPNNQTCPVCKSAISREKVIPLYGRNCTDKKDPRDKVPPRPQGQRTEPTRNANNNFLNGIGLDGLQISFGIGAFPFSFFASSFNFTNDIRIPNPPPGTTQYAEEQILSRIFLIISIIFIIWILLI